MCQNVIVVILWFGRVLQWSRSYCYRGRCNSHNKQCRLLWGSSGHVSHRRCYDNFNILGTVNGHCGFSWVDNKSFKKCDARSAYWQFRIITQILVDRPFVTFVVVFNITCLLCWLLDEASDVHLVSGITSCCLSLLTREASSNVDTTRFRPQSTTICYDFSFDWYLHLRWLWNYGGRVHIKDIFGPSLLKKNGSDENK